MYDHCRILGGLLPGSGLGERPTWLFTDQDHLTGSEQGSTLRLMTLTETGTTPEAVSPPNSSIRSGDWQGHRHKDGTLPVYCWQRRPGQGAYSGEMTLRRRSPDGVWNDVTPAGGFGRSATRAISPSSAGPTTAPPT